MKKIILFMFCLFSFQVAFTTENKAILDADISFIPAKPTDSPKAIQPGTPMVVAVKIKNTGTANNAQGYFFVRFAYPTPLAKHQSSELFVTEKVLLPSIAPGKEASIAFEKMQQLPSVFDFVREDYGMRQYQAVVVIDNKEYVIGNASLTFSAYYYPGPNHEIEVEVPAAEEPMQVGT